VPEKNRSLLGACKCVHAKMTTLWNQLEGSK
jgi:hypothetical protein